MDTVAGDRSLVIQGRAGDSLGPRLAAAGRAREAESEAVEVAILHHLPEKPAHEERIPTGGKAMGNQWAGVPVNWPLLAGLISHPIGAAARPVLHLWALTVSL